MITKELDLEEGSWSVDCQGDVELDINGQVFPTYLSEKDVRAMLKEIEDWRANNERSGQHECS